MHVQRQVLLLVVQTSGEQYGPIMPKKSHADVKLFGLLLSASFNRIILLAVFLSCANYLPPFFIPALCILAPDLGLSLNYFLLFSAVLFSLP